MVEYCAPVFIARSGDVSVNGEEIRAFISLVAKSLY
jgi:hypothetical protein